MAIKIMIPTPLRPFVGNQDEVTLEKDGNVGEILRELASEHKQLQNHLFDQDGNLRKFVNVYLNEDDIRYKDGENTSVTADDVISIVPSIAGGSR